MGHLRIHGQHREHDRDVVDNSRQKSHQHVCGGMAQAVVHEIGGHCQIAELSQAADAEDHAVEKEQCIPFGLGDLAEQVEAGVLMSGHVQRVVAAQLSMFDCFKPVGEERQITQPQHHPDCRWQIQEVME